MLPSPHARRLACDLINEQFGELVQKVCDCLVSRGILLLSQADIMQYTGLPLAQLRSCLSLLIQHSCVQAFRVEHEDELHYMAILDNILHRMRLTKFTTLFSEFGKEAEDLANGLFQHGRSTCDNLIKHVAEGRTNAAEAEVPLREAFLALVRAQYFERCSTDEPTKRMDTKKPRITQDCPTVILETQQETAADMLETDRFDVPVCLEGFGLDEAGNGETSEGHKRKREEDASSFDKEALWRLNYLHILRCLRNQACVKLVRSRTDLGAGIIVACMLEKETDLWDPNSVAEAVLATEEGRGMKRERICGYLSQLMTDGFVYAVGETSQCRINVKRMIDFARRNEIEGIVLQKFGRKCCKILRLLFTGGRLEHKQISERSLVPVKEAWELLQNMAKLQYVELKADEHLSHTFYSWRVNLDNVCHLVVGDMYHAMCNLRPRLTAQLEHEHSKSSEEASSKVGVLKASLLKLDDAILLFHDF